MVKNIGSIYRIEVDNDTVRYFWDVGTDSTQLGSAIIVIFRRSYPKDAVPDLDQIISDDVDFYCHVLILTGKRLGVWSKVGFRHVDRTFPMLFKIDGNMGKLTSTISECWYVWEPGQPMRFVGKLTGENAKAETGYAFPPKDILTRIRTGAWD